MNQSNELPQKQIVTKMELEGDTIKYFCPECGQKFETGINGNEKTSISYLPLADGKIASIEKKMDHSHKYPIFLDVEYFSSRGLDLPVFECLNLFSSLDCQIKGDQSM